MAFHKFGSKLNKYLTFELKIATEVLRCGEFLLVRFVVEWLALNLSIKMYPDFLWTYNSIITRKTIM